MKNLEIIKEKRYYSRKNFESGNERVFEDSNGFRMSYYIKENNVFAYYMGRYYIFEITSETIEEIDLLNFVLSNAKNDTVVD